jgi:hypothetical protein
MVYSCTYTGTGNEDSNCIQKIYRTLVHRVNVLGYRICWHKYGVNFIALDVSCSVCEANIILTFTQAVYYVIYLIYFCKFCICVLTQLQTFLRRL